MDIFKDLFATQGFQLCVKAIQDAQPNGDQDALFKQCQQNYANAYKVVGHLRIDMDPQKISDYYHIITKHYLLQNLKMKKMFQKIFKYNEWRYKKMFESFEKQDNYQQFLVQNQQLFFNNVIGTMKHLLAADYIWYGRIMKLQSIQVPILSKEKIQTIDLKELILLWQSDDEKIFDQLQFDYDQTKSLLLDINQVYQQLIDSCDQAYFDQEFEYQDSKGVVQKKDASTIFYHLINHHSHHLGQISTAYTQKFGRKDFFSTDFIYFK